MKKPLAVMMSILLGMLIVAGVAVGGLWYLKGGHKHDKIVSLTPAQALALQVTLPQMLANLGDGGMMQFTLSLQASDSTTKTEINELQNQIDDYLIRTLKAYSTETVNSPSGFVHLKRAMQTGINRILPTGKVTKVYFSNEIVQPGG